MMAGKNQVGWHKAHDIRVCSRCGTAVRKGELYWGDYRQPLRLVCEGCAPVPDLKPRRRRPPAKWEQRAELAAARLLGRA